MIRPSLDAQTRWIVAIVVLAVLVALTGVASVTTQSSVAADGTVQTYQVRLTMENRTYTDLTDRAYRLGYDSFEAQLRAQFDPERYKRLTINESRHEKFVTINHKPTIVNLTVTVMEWTPPADSPIRVTTNGRNITYVDTLERPDALPDEEYTLQVRKRYTITMPGRILDTNADLVRNNTTAVWTTYVKQSDNQGFARWSGSPDRVYVTSRRPTKPVSGLDIPLGSTGLGIVGVAVLVAVGGGWWWRRRHG